MSDIFLSYAREDRYRAELLSHALQAEGWSVWWDLTIPAGQTFDEVIERELDTARCVIVLWSKESVANRWVRTEAEEGAARGILVPILIDEVKIPLAFRRIQAANLVGWKGDRTAAYGKLLADICAVLARSSGLERESARPKFGPGAAQRVTTAPLEGVQSKPLDKGPQDLPSVKAGPELAAGDRQPEVRRSGRSWNERESRPSASTAPSTIWSLRHRTIALVLQATATIAGTVIAFINIESIIISGSVVAIIGVYLFWCGLRSGARQIQIAGAYGPAIGLVCFLIVWLTRWNPSQAQEPLSIAIAILAVPYVIWLLLLLRSPQI